MKAKLKKIVNLKKRIILISLVVFCIPVLVGIVYFIRTDVKSIVKKDNTVSAEKLISDAKATAKTGDKAGAIKLYEEATAKDPENITAKDDLAMLYYQTKDFAKATETYSQSLAKAPDDSFTLNSLANSYRDQGKTDQAITTYLKAIETGNLESVGNLVTLYNSNQEYDQSITLLNTLIKKYPEDKDLGQLLASTKSKKRQSN